MDNGMAYRVCGIAYNNKFDIQKVKIKSVIDEKVVTLDELEDMIQTGEVIDCEIVLDENKDKHIKCYNKDLKDMTVLQGSDKFGQNSLTAVETITIDNELHAYRFEQTDGNKYNFSPIQTWELARRGIITNMIAKYEDDQKVVCGSNGCNLWELPVINKQQ